MINLNHALIEKRPEWARRHGKVILLHDNAPAHKAKSVQDTIKAFSWKLLPHPPYSPGLAPSFSQKKNDFIPVQLVYRKYCSVYNTS